MSRSRRSIGYLMHSLEKDDSWLPLWFGNQHLPHEVNPTYGTAKGLMAAAFVASHSGTKSGATALLYNSSVSWFARNQMTDGGWGRSAAERSSVEETALALEALANAPRSNEPRAKEALARGLDWLLRRVEDGTWTQPAPIGFYFAKLWYFEELYPLIHAVGAVRSAS